MHSRQLTPSDLHPGQLITVLDIIQEASDPGGFGSTSNTTIVVGGGGGGTQTKDYRGGAFRVLAIDLPFILVTTPDAHSRFVLDSRRYTFMELKLEYWQALCQPSEGLSDFEKLCGKHNNLTEIVRRMGVEIQALRELLAAKKS